MLLCLKWKKVFWNWKNGCVGAGVQTSPELYNLIAKLGADKEKAERREGIAMAEMRGKAEEMEKWKRGRRNCNS